MSDMTDDMTKKVFLDVCAGIEKLCADLYHHYSTIYQDIPEAASLWKKTALEEENHQKQFELALRLWDETEFDVLNDSLKQAYTIQYKLMTFMNNIKSSKPDLLTAVSKAIEMEKKLAALHVNTALKFKEASMQDMFKALSEADNGHMADLQRYQSILSLPHCEMEG
ncbi:MAG: hypothetical protein A2076_07215 [Geobacteraceae bacterium GWC2_53_11]|nr:MAG: hypothetical protein A2076_07215 [Geobacteraceae bacterium GWC2_53_11]